ncbi:MAG TPA: P-loop NTPase [Acidimicrobiia bacterium]
MDLTDHLRTIGANWWRILLIAVIIGGGVFAFSKSQKKTYRASELVSVAPQLNQNGAPEDSQTLAFKVSAFSQILSQDSVAQSAVTIGNLDKKYGLGYKDVQSGMSQVDNAVGGLILVRFASHNTQEALDTVDAIAKSLQQNSAASNAISNQTSIASYNKAIAGYQQALQNKNLSANARTQIESFISNAQVQIAQLQQPNAGGGSITLQTTPQLDNSGAPISPTPTRDGVLAFLVAAVIAAESFVVVRALSDRVSKATDVATITDLTGLPVLAQVPHGRGPEVVEAFRTLRTNLMFLEGAGQPRTIALLSPNAGAGKSFCTVQLGESAVAVDAQVVLVDADLRRPVLHSRLRVNREPGLTDVLRGTPLAKSVHAVDSFQNLRLIPSGTAVSDTVGALGGRALHDVLEEIDDAELVIVDTPPGDYADALAIAAQCDAALLVLDAQTTRRRSTKQFLEALERTGASLIGVILNNAPVSKRAASYDRS